MRGRSVCWCGLFFTWISLSTGERLYPCGADGYRDVEENTAITFYCDQYSNVTWGVTWKYRTPASVSNTIVTIAVCTDTACTSSFIWNVAYISAGNSSVATTLPVHTSRIQAGAQYQCDDQNCTLHIIVPAEVSQPTTTMTRQDSGYTLSVSADVTQVYSSRGLYSCIGQLGPSSQTTQPDLTPPASDVSNTTNRAGKCDVTMSLPVTSGTYPCSVTVTPGNTQRSCGNITIARPPPPTISCPSDPIAENTSFTCRCDTSDIGQPGGRLRWYTGTGSDVNTEVISGTYDTNTLAMTRTVTRHDNNVRKFRCVNNWMVNVTAQSDYTARVAWGPDTVSIQGNTAFYTDTAQSQTMTLTCQANGVNPSPSLTYSWDRLCDDKQQSTCTFKPGPGDDNTVIRCTVTNVNNNNRPQHNAVTLDIKYPPSSPRISGYINGQVLYEGNSLTLNCTVTGGDPMVTSVTLTCPGQHNQSPTSGQSSRLLISRLSASDHNLTCVCHGQWVRGDYYTLTDSRTLTVYFSVKSVQLTINSQTALLEVRESQSTHVTFQCTAGFARPSPTLVLSDDQGREVARLTGGPAHVTGQQSVLTHTLRTVRCENSAVYTCTAQNGVGKPIQTTATLRVLCDMRVLGDSFSSQQDGIPVVEAGTEPGELHFQLLTTDTPHTVSFLYLGPDSTGAGYSPTSGLLSAKCAQTSVAYKSRCVIRAFNVTQHWIGYYNVTIATGTQSVSFTFRLQMKESSDSRCPTCSCGQWFEAFGAGLGVGLAILVVVVFVILLCLWRRQWKLPCAEGPSNKSADNDSNVRTAPVESSLETEMSACATSGTGPYEELKQSDIGLRSVYSDISGPSPQSPETDGEYEIPLQRVVPAAATGR